MCHEPEPPAGKGAVEAVKGSDGAAWEHPRHHRSIERHNPAQARATRGDSVGGLLESQRHPCVPYPQQSSFLAQAHAEDGADRENGRMYTGRIGCPSYAPFTPSCSHAALR